MTDQEINKWVEEHIKVPPKEELDKHTTVECSQLVPALIEWGKVIAHKFYKLRKSEIPINLTWQDIKKIVNIADAMLDDPKMRIAIQNHSEEEYYQKVLDEWQKQNGSSPTLPKNSQ